MKNRALIVGIAFAFALAGCAGLTISQSQLDKARTLYQVQLAVVAAYVQLPRCPIGTNWTLKNQCSTLAAIKTIAKYEDDAHAKFDAIQASMINGKATISDLDAIETILDSIKGALASAEPIGSI